MRTTAACASIWAARSRSSQGRSILLAPAVDAWQKLHWLCVPIDIPSAYVPATCSQ